MESDNRKDKIREHIIILLLFIVLTSILIYPVITRVIAHAAGDGGDGFQFKWNIWHIKQVLTKGDDMSYLYYTEFKSKFSIDQKYVIFYNRPVVSCA